MAESNHIDPAYAYIDGKVRSLKGQMTKLRNRMETLEVSGLQEQITSLSSQIIGLDSVVLSVERSVAELQIRHNLLWALWALEPMQKTPDVTNCIRFVRETASLALGLIPASNNPDQIAIDWFSKCKDYFSNHGGFEIFG